jgi:hypothetical protein
MGWRTQPADVEGYGRGDRRGFLDVEQGVGDIEKVPDLKVRRRHPRCAVVEVDRHTAALVIADGAAAHAVFVAGPKRDGPEQAARVGVDPWVEVVHLGGEVLEVEPTSVKIQSNESERPPVDSAILADVDTLHKTHIRVEEECLFAAVGVPGGSLSPHVCDADSTFEVGDR